ncbi:MAG: hypothetical protein ACLT38_05235 [Akkermansia sp.]
MSNIVGEMTARLVKGLEDQRTRETTVIALSPHGKRVAAMLTELCKDVEVAVEDISKETP